MPMMDSVASPPPSAGLDGPNTSSLDKLQADQSLVLDVMDKLRRTGLNGVLQLPQLVVCGDQSSGKSSALEAISEIPFPRRESVCTRFATKVVLRRAKQSSIAVRIVPDKHRPAAEVAELAAFERSISDFQEMPQLVDEATALMGLDASAGGRAFARDVLRLEISGPNRPQL